MKKSIPFKEYKRKAMDFDKITEGKTPERVEDMVRNLSLNFSLKLLNLFNIFIFSFGRISHSVLLCMVQICK